MSPTHDASQPRRPLSEALISVVLPVYNESGVLDQLTSQVVGELSACGCRYELVFVNDGSTDGSAARLDALAAANPRIRVLHLSRNFGHQAAVHAGLSHARGDAIVVMDSDLQDDPQAIRRFLNEWQSGYDVVYAVRSERKEHLIKRGLFRAFYRVLNGVANTRIPMDAGNFGLLDRRVAEEIAALVDRDRYFPGLRSWVGFRQAGVTVARGRRLRRLSTRVTGWAVSAGEVGDFLVLQRAAVDLLPDCGAVAGFVLRGRRVCAVPQTVHRTGDSRLGVDDDHRLVLRSAECAGDWNPW